MIAMEWFPLPVMKHREHRFLYRFTYPITTIWMEGLITGPGYGDPEHLGGSMDNRLERFACENWDRLCVEWDVPDLKPALMASVLECKMVRK